MKVFTTKKILLIARLLKYPYEAVLNTIEVVECELTHPTPTANRWLTDIDFNEPPMPMASLIACDKGNAYMVYINDRLSFVYYEYNNTYVVQP